MKGFLAIIIALIFFLLFLNSCEKNDEHPQFPSSEFISSGEYLGEYWPTDSWRKCSPEEVGMDSEKLEELHQEMLLLMDLHVEIHNIIIIIDGYIVAEQYYTDKFDTDTLHQIASCTKSITSSLFGIALDMNYYESVDNKVIDFFPEYSIENLSDHKKNITIEHLLTMSSGLEWCEIEYPYGDERNSYTQWIRQGGGIKFVLDQPTIAPPGELYSYNTGGSHILSGILQKVTGTRTDSFAIEHLFKPLGIGEFHWPADGKGISYGGSSMRLTPRDMARFGYLYLNRGNWDGARIIPEDWIDKSQQQHIKRRYIDDYYYGYHWWVSDKETYSAVGFGGQWITIVPQHDLVVIYTNRFVEGEMLQQATPDRLLHTYIIPAIK